MDPPDKFKELVKALAPLLKGCRSAKDVTLYYGKVKGGTGYQALIPKDISACGVLKFVAEVALQ